ncbi:MAG: GAF domain-containing protein, partial [Bacteriovorax sp.]|nr:GAF domain-containing protein [Bacteriovorax sp.]
MTRLKSKTNLNHKKTFTSYVEIKNIISQILFGEDLSNILDVILLHLEDKLPKARASILLFDKKNNCLRNIAAPSLPESFCQLIDGIKIGPKVGSCGTAAYFKSTTVVRDTFSDPLWATYLEAAKTFNLRSCWSVPILNMKGELLGTLALYYGTPHKPTQAESILVKE